MVAPHHGSSLQAVIRGWDPCPSCWPGPSRNCLTCGGAGRVLPRLPRTDLKQMEDGPCARPACTSPLLGTAPAMVTAYGKRIHPGCYAREDRLEWMLDCPGQPLATFTYPSPRQPCSGCHGCSECKPL